MHSTDDWLGAVKLLDAMLLATLCAAAIHRAVSPVGSPDFKQLVNVKVACVPCCR